MRLTIVIMTMLLMQVSARSTAQKVSLSENNTSILQVFNLLRSQTGYDFLYSDEILKLAKPVTLYVKDKPLADVLNSIFEKQELVYVLKNKAVIVSKREAGFFDALKNYLARIDVAGKVLDESGKPLPGATVKVKNENRLVITGADGSFMLRGIDEKAILVISYLGYKTKEVSVKPQLIISIEPENANLEEVGVISTGYQKIKKDQLTGAASNMNEEQYQQRVAVTGNFLESLEGKVPGLVYNSQTGELTIRGVSTFDAVKKPLIVLDGFPTEIDLRTINPNDIVSVNVLRDAAAASIYGVRASNGVIIVETRRGKSGKAVFNLRSTYAIQNKPDFSYLNYAPANEFVQLQVDKFNIEKRNYSSFSKTNPVQEIMWGLTRLDFSNPLLTQAQADAKLKDLGSYDNLKEYEKLFYQKRQAQNVNLDVSGGNERNTYMLGLNYVREQPVTRRSESQQFILNMANTFKFSERFNFDFKGTYTNYTDKSGNIPDYNDFFPYERLADANGSALPVSLMPNRAATGRNIGPALNQQLMGLGLYDAFYYPYRELTSNTNTAKGSTIRLQGRLNAKITNWLSVDVGGNYENQNVILDKLSLEDSYKVRNMLNMSALKDDSGRAVFKNMTKGDILSKTNQKLSNYTLRGQLNLNHRLNNNHDFSGIFGVEQKNTLNKAYLTSFFGYDSQTLVSGPIDMNALNAVFSPAFSQYGVGYIFGPKTYFNQSEDDRRFMSYYGQGTYIFNGKYVATGSFRIDQSNLFGVDPKFRNKPLWSAGLNWRLGEEEFIRKYDWIQSLQLRAATGSNGNIPVTQGGKFLLLENGLNTLLDVAVPYTSILSPENQSLRWETTRNYNLGLDYTLWRGRLSGSVDWYLKKSTDVFGEFDADPTLGFNQYQANTASIQNKGIEFLFNTLNIKSSRFQWRTQLTASLNNNKVLSVKATEFDYSDEIASGNRPVQGMPIGALYSYNYGGLNEKGQPFVYDKNGNRKIIDYSYSGGSSIDVTINDMIYNGATVPKYVLGLNNQFGLGAFDLSFLFMYYGGHVMRVEPPDPNNVGSFNSNPVKGSSNYWRKAGDEQHTRMPGFVRASTLAPGYYPSSALYGYTFASEFVRKADYIRLRDVVLTYHAKATFLKKAGLSNTQLRFQAQNVFRYTFSGNDIDPEAINPATGIRKLETQPFYSLTFSTNF
ncbi:TonB-linked SusC/RagA family outer membrane protein [Pedobacter africanus]|uniref:TonB-linked SusC/RagA family outer membrane protein n=1 Tax=Pedobacter africanus TaxID=151894 RepID=A0ACC6L041_9SPHI|nr:SusC/RagA family TonB-linked outer membrane protein [Pedobacter africanus]MDR6784841.1 TonB-linked SusC/RagA family outer membrane protein [Pedobacter africanus]